ncbi:MAG: tetratricopeptide repeat protein [Gemmatimonadota bacterium]|nr:tetratricopeptide repeat protein [Gemmatimonadota bacterium]
MRRLVPEGTDPRSYQVPVLGVIGLALLASVTSLANGFAYDDRWIIVENPTVHDIAHWWNVFGDTYWPSIRNAALYRPLTILAYVVQWAAGGGTPLLFHVINVVLYAALCALVYGLALQMLPRRAAWVAAALFAVHPVHVEAVGNVVGQAELWAAISLVAGVAVYLAARRDGLPVDRHTKGVIAAVYLGGMLFKENAIVLPALLVAAEAFAVHDTRPWRLRAAELGSLLVWLTLLAAIILGIRVWVTGELGGDVEHPALRNLDVWQRAWVMLAIAPEFGRLLVWPAHLYADYSPRQVPLLPEPTAYHASGALLLLCLLVLAVVSVRRFPMVTFALAWIAVCLAPVANILIPTGILVAERTLLVPSVAAVLLAASLVPWFEGRLEGLRREWRLAAAGALAVVLALGAARSAERQHAWKDSDTVFDTMVRDEPMSFKAHYANGGRLWEAHRPGEAEREWRYAIALFPTYFGVYQDLAHKYREAHVCPAAIPLYQKALELEPELPLSRVGLTACYLEMAQFRKARAESREAISWGYYRRAFEYMIERADSALVAYDSLDGTNRWKRRPAR